MLDASLMKPLSFSSFSLRGLPACPESQGNCRASTLGPLFDAHALPIRPVAVVTQTGDAIDIHGVDVTTSTGIEAISTRPGKG